MSGDRCPECNGEIEWAYCDSDVGKPMPCPLCKAMIRSERSEEEGRDGIMQYRYDWWHVGSTS